MRLTWLPEVLRAAGLTVHVASGWHERGSSSWGPIEGITIHETRGSRTSTDAGEIRVLINGSNSAPPPIAQLYLSRSGEWWVIASGRCNHNLVGWAGPNRGLGNSRLLGIEAQHAAGEPWTARQYDSYVRGVAALVRHLRIPVGRVAGHTEHQPWPAPAGQTSTKSDPEFDMTKFRRDVAARMVGEDNDMDATQAAQLANVERMVGKLLKGGLGPGPDNKPDNVAHFRLRSIQDAMDPVVAQHFPSWPIDAPGLKQLGEMLTFVQLQLKELAGKDVTDEPAIVEGVLAGLGSKPAPEVAQALVAAGQDPAVLAAELTKLAQPQG